ncbi:hypothetical protein CERZMDRAFT_88805 [Cercospora zeae-maydis SCOH1-5]|uniref:Uncharacterized protein n=1 Tax=Cercospora zeae-maydis SCOH1-5 TaxID=717836 RepID=A0A6A6EXT4_9PEZI|nr:hypothetical protein CERZMDRAFT_88805 [Cercospora zeae-maydis SCOH1-5]
MAELTSSYTSTAEARAAARSAYARRSEEHATPTRRPSRRSRHSQGSHFELARRRSTRSNTSTSTQKHEPAPVLSISTATTSIPEAAPFSTPRPPACASLRHESPLPQKSPAENGHTAEATTSPDNTAAGTRPVPAHTPTPRHFSINIKGRLKQVFRKSTPVPIALVAPPASLAANQNEVVDGPADISATSVPAAEAPARTTPHEQEPFARPYSTSTRSRVTSWTNSTIAAVSSIRSRRRPSHHLDSAAQPMPEPDLRKKSSFFLSSARPRTQPDILSDPLLEANSGELRKKASFFGGPVRNRLHRGSGTDLKESSEESLRLYSALQKRIRPSKSERTMSRQRLSTPVDLSALEGTTLFEPTLPTVRTITPEPGTRTANVPSPVTEVVSPGSSLKRRSALRVPHASRTDVISPSVYSRGTDGISLRPLSPEGEEGTTTILITGREVRRYSISPAKPQSRHHRGNGSGSWRKWLSDEMRTSLGTTGPGYQSLNVPSDEQYLQARRTPSPAMQSFSQDSPSPAKPRAVHHGAHGSGTWRKWLSDEMKTTLGNNDQQFRLLNSEKLRPRSISPLSEAADGGRPARPTSRAGSVVSAMNDRYPRIAPSPVSLHDQRIVLPSFRPPSRSSHAEVPRPPTRQSVSESVRAPSGGLNQPTRLPSRNRPLHTHGSKENVRPPSISGRAPESPLPALSSSQWLATGSQHKMRTEVRKPSLKDAVMKPSLSRLSARQSTFSMREPPRDGLPSKPASLTRQSMMEMRTTPSRRSPGQHMVTDWLNERKGRERDGWLGNRPRAELEDTSIGGGVLEYASEALDEWGLVGGRSEVCLMAWYGLPC